ncbi:M48 family metallopeptidase [Frigidibacter sp. MR17.24]|uniref:M48 family metallopeptidase n=1 Tax=Frigidibacter sp. MR17.24 TaxID=3127345 RepID=UPI003012FEF1
MPCPALPLPLPRRALMALAALALSACQQLGGYQPAGPAPTAPLPAYDADTGPLTAREAARNFASVVNRMEPAIEAECRQRAPQSNCDFQIVVDDRPGQEANAFQTLDDSGRPIVAFNLALIGDARNMDELAFVMGHEAAHHIAGHIPRQQQSAAAGAAIFGGLAQAYGLDAARAQQIGAGLAGRAYAKDYELEADRLGTIIAFDAGFDPEKGARFFTRLPDPGDRFLGSHPPNAERIQVVQATLAAIRSGQIR